MPGGWRPHAPLTGSGRFPTVARLAGAPTVDGGGPPTYDRHMATAEPTPTPNPDAMKFTLDTTLPAMVNVTNAAAAAGNPFVEELFAVPGVKSVFAVNDFVTVTRDGGADWDPIIAAVRSAAAAHL